MILEMGKKPINLEDEQLYRLFSKYTNCINNSNDKGIILGYSILEALLNYRNMSNSEEEKVFEEVKHVYEVLKNNLELLISEDTDTTKIIYDIKFKVDEQLQKPINSTSKIVLDFVSTLTKKNNQIDYMKKVGLNLYMKVNDKGPFMGNKNILLNDFETLKETYS